MGNDWWRIRSWAGDHDQTMADVMQRHLDAQRERQMAEWTDRLMGVPPPDDDHDGQGTE
jgi:hypothetical protein